MFGKMFSFGKASAKKNLVFYTDFCSQTELDQLEDMFEKKECGVSFSSFGITTKLAKDQKYPVLHKLKETISDADFLDTINAMALTHTKKLIYADIAKDASKRFVSFFDTKPEVLNALLHQSFSDDPFHILFVADKLCYADTLVEILQNVHPHGRYVKAEQINGGEVSLEPTFDNKKIVEQGVLADLDGGLLSIFQYDKLGEEQLVPLHAAMRDQSLTYDVGSKIFKLPAKVNVLGFTLPNTAHFVGKAAGLYRQQMPVPADVQEKFHLVLCVRCRKEGCLAPLTFSETDLEFVQDYISYALQISVSFPKSFEKHVVDWHKLLAKETKNYIAPVTSQYAITLIRYSIAHARMHLRDEVTIDDLKYSMDFLQDALGLFEYE